jgi:2-amino-4-hydroxy-6-hydroxymethyldihydropteridine diphosphokinase
MNEIHDIFLNIGSNIQPGIHLPEAIDQLRKYGSLRACSTAWESTPVGSAGPNFLNASVQVEFSRPVSELKEQVFQAIETTLGRARSSDKNAPRTIDIDITMVDEIPANLEQWKYPFVVVPMAELAPELAYPLTHEKLIKVALRMRAETWIIERPDVLKASRSND